MKAGEGIRRGVEAAREHPVSRLDGVERGDVRSSQQKVSGRRCVIMGMGLAVDGVGSHVVVVGGHSGARGGGRGLRGGVQLQAGVHEGIHCSRGRHC